jgi:hypothetical protein
VAVTQHKADVQAAVEPSKKAVVASLDSSKTVFAPSDMAEPSMIKKGCIFLFKVIINTCSTYGLKMGLQLLFIMISGNPQHACDKDVLTFQTCM